MPHRAVVVLPGAELTLDRRALAAATWIGQPVAATSSTALYLAGVVDKPPRRLQLVVPHTRRNRSWPHGIVHRSDVAAPRTVTNLRGVPSAKVAWALRDMAVFGGSNPLRGTVIAALQRRRTSLEELEAVVAANPTAAGVPGLTRILEMLRRDRVDSGLELDTRFLARSAGFDPWPRPFPYRCPDRVVIHFDVAFRDVWTAVECGDPATHGSLKSFYVDRTRLGQAMRGGWRVVFAWRERLLHDRDGLIEEIREAHESADPNRPPAEPAHDCDVLGC